MIDLVHPYTEEDRGRKNFLQCYNVRVMAFKINKLQLKSFYESNRDDYYSRRGSGDISLWDEQYKWDILPKLNTLLAKYETITGDNFGDIVSEIRKSNPSSGSFAHWIDMDDLDLLVKAKNGFQVFRDLWTAAPENIAAEIDSANTVSSLLIHDKKFSPSTYAFILAAKDCNNFSIHRDWVAKELATINGVKMPSSQGDKYKLLNDSALYIGSLMQEDRLVSGLEYNALNGQDFLWVVLNAKLGDGDKLSDAHAYIDKGFICVDDTARFKTHVDIAKLFGKEYKGHQSATIDIDDEWVIWFPKLYKNGDWDNEISPDGKTITMRYVPGGRYGKDRVFEENPNGKTIVFGHKIDKDTSERYYEFVGIFTRLQGTYLHATCDRIADTLYIDGSGGFSISGKQK